MSIVDENGNAPVRGDDLEIRRNVTMRSGLVAATAWFTLKRSRNAADASADKQLSITTTETLAGHIEDSGVGGTAIIRFDFGGVDWSGILAGVAYYYDIQVGSTSGLISTVEMGTVTFTRDITVTTS